MIFRSNPRFIFHDSRGFEAGNTMELKLVKQFLDERALKFKLKERVHAIWYITYNSNWFSSFKKFQVLHSFDR